MKLGSAILTLVSTILSLAIFLSNGEYARIGLARGKLKVLCLHGYQINGRLFQNQLQSIVNRCSDKYEFGK